MRLSKIKLAGFKTFVDPTTVTLQQNLTGVVGPNGCGKSNIIDAVRWVMGESSAKNLRGDAMTDVIFNGSSARKPVGSAMIELIFDNADGKIGGEYANYAEVSIKRSMSRDGTSIYYLNNARCRRKDITRVFLGTGLGPRSYSIIEQGMISRVVDAKPDELRVYIEEAAGISKYKDRRRETSNRIKHTRENLERLNDLREEVSKQLRHLTRQANLAEKYKTYKNDQRRINAELIALRLADMQDRQAVEARLTAEKENEFEAAVARQRELEAKIEKSRARHADKGEQFNAVQESFYKLGAEIARIEQFIQHTRDLRQRQQSDLDECLEALQELDIRVEEDSKRVNELDRSIKELTPGWDTLREKAQQSEAAYQEAEKAMQAWRGDWNDVQREASETGRRGSVEKTRIEHLEGQLQTLITRQQRLAVERSELSVEELSAELTQLASNEASTKTRLVEDNGALTQVAQRIQQAREEDRALTAKLDTRRADLQQQKGRLASLEALQQDALAQKAGDGDWLARAGLSERPRLAQELQVEKGWELAVETVLGDYLEAVCVDGIEQTAEALAYVESGRVGLVETSQIEGAHGTLLAKVRGKGAVRSLLESVRVAGSLGEALRMRGSLQAGETVVTADGVWLGRDWLRINRDDSQSGGVIVREQEIRTLQQSCRALANEVQELSERHDQARTTLRQLETQRDQLQDKVNQTHREHVDLVAALDARRSHLEHVSTRVNTLAADADDLDAQIQRTDAALTEARERHDEAQSQLRAIEDRQQRLDDRQASTREQLEAARSDYERDRRAAHEVEVKLESQRSAHASLAENLARQREQRVRLTERRDALVQQIAAADEPLATHQTELTGELQRRLTVEGELADARRELEAIDERLRKQQERRNAVEAEVEERREAVAAVKISAQEIKIRRDTLLERFAETGFELEEITNALPEEASAEAWQESHEKLEQRISRLGPINLAAIDEHKESAERKEYLDAQFNDLTEALETLEKAIGKIDRETRTRFKETFDQINQGFQHLFPKLFGGGHAYLELSDTDLLTTGVTIMARPPGKRNSTIHLLSGGEKALTAVSLVFAIFELNPAPFCMLDEVDAPLDDANVNRFCNILSEMSERVQFIFITHNKTTISLSEQLVGVTMQEAGVSRLVAVDIDEAIQMAEAS